MTDKHLDMAMVHKLCPVCTRKVEEHILMDTKFRSSPGKLEAELHNKAIGIADTMCNDCKEAIGEGIYLIEIDAAKSEDTRNPWRTGNIAGVSREFWERNFNMPVPEKQISYAEAPIVMNIQKQSDERQQSTTE
jgi:hypothetical protein